MLRTPSKFHVFFLTLNTHEIDWGEWLEVTTWPIQHQMKWQRCYKVYIIRTTLSVKDDLCLHYSDGDRRSILYSVQLLVRSAQLFPWCSMMFDDVTWCSMMLYAVLWWSMMISDVLCLRSILGFLFSERTFGVSPIKLFTLDCGWWPNSTRRRMIMIKDTTKENLPPSWLYHSK